MSSDTPSTGSPEPVREDGDGRVPVDAVCTGCSQVRVKWVSEDEADGSFRHACHICKTVTWMNTVARLHGLEGHDGDDDE